VRIDGRVTYTAVLQTTNIREAVANAEGVGAPPLVELALSDCLEWLKSVPDSSGGVREARQVELSPPFLT